jgi:hypothetical protein
VTSPEENGPTASVHSVSACAPSAQDQPVDGRAGVEDLVSAVSRSRQHVPPQVHGAFEPVVALGEEDLMLCAPDGRSARTWRARNRWLMQRSRHPRREMPQSTPDSGC